MLLLSGAVGAAVGIEEVGKGIYEKGIGTAGRVIQATVVGDVRISGTQLSCVECHQKSGLGWSEGGTVPPPLNSSALYSPRRRGMQLDKEEADEGLRVAYRSASVDSAGRPAYNEESLARAIRDGIDSAGRSLDPMMPRYQLDDSEMASVIEYLKTLSVVDAPGVTDSTIHLATIVADGVDATRKRAMLEILEMQIKDRNAGTRGEILRARHSPNFKRWEYESYRQFELHVWQLSADPGQWRAQLEAHYEREPVFAMMSGIVEGEWSPIHEFCEDYELPCLFPNTALPAPAEGDFFSIYFNGGVSLEANALAHLFRDPSHAVQEDSVIQVHRMDGAGIAAARELTDALKGSLRLRSWEIEQEQDFATGVDAQNFSESDLLVSWLEGDDLALLAKQIASSASPGRVIVSESMAGDQLDTVREMLGDRLYVIRPRDLPEKEALQFRRVGVWLRSRDIEVRHPHLQADTYLAVTLTASAITHLGKNFSRELLIERLEHVTDTSVYTGFYPRLSLGPGQRYASKGCYLLRNTEGLEPSWEVVGDWIVP
ncbi:MAG: hypothetical protein CL938_04070 [Deltaproteobacteria bacterium]|jgi:hypothetical protein|nr:hypothetical protein [Deltaproteobacteria bacterium]MDP7299901.1 c-type cytochrome [Myxococcota bacterium]